MVKEELSEKMLMHQGTRISSPLEFSRKSASGMHRPNPYGGHHNGGHLQCLKTIFQAEEFASKIPIGIVKGGGGVSTTHFTHAHFKY